MKKIYMVQTSDSFGKGKTEARYLPYAAGILIACAFEDPLIAENYSFGGFIYRKDPPDQVAASLTDPSVVGFSCYLWNFEYNLALAAEIKKRFPDCVTVFGGHHISMTSASQLDEYPFIDFLIHGEGEVAFPQLVAALAAGGDVDRIPNISYRNKEGKAIKTAVCELTTLDFPSPYLKGYYDELVEKTDIEWTALFETNRGCPFRCAYCDWGSLGQKIRHVPTERIIDEFQWFSDHKIVFAFCIDSNFGMFPRDFNIVDKFLEIRQKTGYPKIFKCCITEGSGMKEFEITKKLNSCQLLKSACLSMQSLCPEALENIGRKNMSLERYGQLTSMYNKAEIPTYSELILGLPGESYDSFVSNISYMLDSGTTNGLMIHFCELLPNARMALPENIEKFKIKAVRIPFEQFHCVPGEELTEYSNIVVSTYSMDYKSWVDSCIFGFFVESMHFMCITRYISMYLHYEHGVSYKDFYERLIRFSADHPETVIGENYAKIKNDLAAYEETGHIERRYYNPKYSEITFSQDEGICLEILHQPDRFYEEIASFCLSFVPVEKTDELRQILKYQRVMVRGYEDTETSISFDYDCIPYFYGISIGRYVPLAAVKNTITVCNSLRGLSPADFATKVLWYGKNNMRMIFSLEEITRKTET